MNDKQIKHMVDRFLGWKLPDDFMPDGGIKFTPPQNTAPHWWPVGTNVFTATQAEAMIRHLAQGIPPSDELVALTKSHPIPSEDKLERRMKRLQRMEHFYTEKIVEAPEKQALMFGGFVSALMYAMTIIKMYRKLTKQLAELAEEADSDATRLDS